MGRNRTTFCIPYAAANLQTPRYQVRKNAHAACKNRKKMQFKRSSSPLLNQSQRKMLRPKEHSLNVAETQPIILKRLAYVVQLNITKSSSLSAWKRYVIAPRGALSKLWEPEVWKILELPQSIVSLSSPCLSLRTHLFTDCFLLLGSPHWFF